MLGATPFFQFSSIFSSEIPFVSGTKNHTKITEITQINPKMAKVMPVPIFFVITGNKALTMMLQMKFVATGKVIKKPFASSGKISETNTHATGPIEYANEHINPMIAATASHFEQSPNCVPNKLENANKNILKPIIIEPDNNRGFLPTLSVKYIATKVIRKFTTPITIVIFIAADGSSKPTLWKIFGA